MTIRLRLTLYWAIVLSAILLIAGMAVLLLFAREQWGQLDSALMEEADTSASAITRLGAGSAAAIVRQLGAERDLGPTRRIRLWSRARVISESGPPEVEPPGPRVRPAFATVESRGGRLFRFAIMPLTVAGEGAWLADGVDATAVRSSIARLKWNLLVILPLILGISSSGGYWLAGRALVPIGQLSAALREIEPRDLSRRLPTGPVDDEVAHLSRAINALLERIERVAQTERRFATDAAHELRTPLAILRTGLEVTLSRDRTAAAYADSLAAALHETVTLCRMTDELLALARLDYQSAIERERCDLRTLVGEISETVEPIVQSKGIDLQRETEDAAFVHGNRDQLRRLIVNLLDNALKFSRTGGRITIALANRGGAVTLRIADEGPGITAEELPRIFDRFFRGKARSESGSGLGLSLCHEIVRLHDGVITAANRAQGGAEFVVRLPAA